MVVGQVPSWRYNEFFMSYLLPKHTGTLDSETARRALLGFFLSGLLVSLPGSLLPAWGHHLQSSFLWVAFYFFILNLGFVLAVQAAHWALPNYFCGQSVAVSAFRHGSANGSRPTAMISSLPATSTRPSPQLDTHPAFRSRLRHLPHT